MEILDKLELFIISFCAFVGSIKASIEFDKNKSLLHIVVNVMIGFITGMALVHYYSSYTSLGLSVLIAVVGGACGAIVLESLLSLLPAVSRKFIKNFVNKLME